MYQVQDAYEQQKQEEIRRLEDFNKKEKELRERDLAVQERFIDFVKVIEENKAKLNRATLRVAEENTAIEGKNKKKEELENRLHELRQKARAVEDKVRDMKHYEDILETVRANNREEFSDINDIIGLYDKLKKANIQLKEQYKELEAEKNRLKVLKDDSEKQKNDELFQLEIDIRNLTTENEKLDTRRADLTAQVDESSSVAIRNQVEIGHIFMAVDNLYERCRDQTRLQYNKDIEQDVSDDPTTKKTNEAIQKLKVIKTYMKDFHSIIRELPESVANAKSSTGKEKEIIKWIQKAAQPS